MISKDDLKKLATLSRLAIPDEELASLQKGIEGVLAYVEQLQEAGGEKTPELPDHRNVFREDAAPHESGIYTEAILREAPHTENGYVKVKKILS